MVMIDGRISKPDGQGNGYKFLLSRSNVTGLLLRETGLQFR